MIASLVIFLVANDALGAFYNSALVTPLVSAAVDARVPFPGLRPLLIIGTNWAGTLATTYLKYLFYVPIGIFVITFVLLPSFGRRNPDAMRKVMLFFVFGLVMLANLYPELPSAS